MRKCETLFCCEDIMAQVTAEWKKGFPRTPGYYHCRVEGGEVDLLMKRCELTGKCHWVYKDGSYITEEVEYLDARKP